jgi:outer membrane protein assembly factor BamB
VVAWNQEYGATLIFTSNEAGYFTAFDQATHEPVWSINFGGGIRSTPLVEGRFVWVAPTYAHRMYKLDAGTGAVQCSAPLKFNTDASATIGDPPGGSPTIYIGVNDTGPYNGPVVGIDEATCAVNFSVTPEPKAGTGGVWDGLSYALDAQGQGLVLFGTADPDSAVYALDAVTGALVWRYATQNPPPGVYDIGAGVTISPPGVNGFVDGVAYVVNKDGYLDALDLSTGALIWTVHRHGTISTPALVGSNLVYGDGSGVTSLNAATGTPKWRTDTQSLIDGSLDIVGPTGSQVAAYGDLSGQIHVLSVATGAQLYQYQTGTFIVSAVAEDDDNLIITSADGFLYDLTPGGGNGAAPSTSVTSPSDSSTITNPNGSLTLTGSAGATAGPPVGGVQVSVQQGGTSGQWWDSATGKWTAAPYGNPATLTAPGSSTTDWSLAIPIAPAGGSYQVFASSVGTNGVADVATDQAQPTAARVSFTVQPSTSAPILTLSSAWGAPKSALTVSGAGFRPSEAVAISLSGSTLRTVTAAPSGALPASTITVPTTIAFGPASVVASGQSSGLTSSAPLYVTNSWSQFRSNSNRIGSEPNDSVLADHLSISESTFLTQAWSLNSDSPIDTSPAVVDAVAYFSNRAGVTYAVDVRTGIPRWTHRDSGGSAIDSSPAVDPAAGTVVVGTGSGLIVALKTSDGTVKWTKSLGTSAVESSPAVVGGVIYVGSDGGILYALKEQNGAVLWHHALGGAVHSSPAVDSSANLVVVGDDSGDIAALSTQTGAVQWMATTGGSVVATPVVSGGTVYVGSEDGKMYAMTEASGAQKWSTDFSGAITASAALAGSTLLVGDQGGHLAYLTPTTGQENFSQDYGSAIVGTSMASGFSVAETANGLVSGSKGPGRGGWSVRLRAGLDTSPTIVNGEIFVDGKDGMLHCYTIPGTPPV